MNLTPMQRSVLLALTTGWQTPMQIADKIPQANANPSEINQPLKDLIREGLVLTNPVVIGLYRLTMKGSAIKGLELGQ